MKMKEIEVGRYYIAKVSGKLTTVRVDAIRVMAGVKRDRYSGRTSTNDKTVYDVTNLVTGRKTTFQSAMKFRSPATKKAPKPQKQNYVPSKKGDEAFAKDQEAANVRLIQVGRYTYSDGGFDAQVGDEVLLPSSWVLGSEGRSEIVTAIGSDYEGPVKAILGIKKKHVEHA